LSLPPSDESTPSADELLHGLPYGVLALDPDGQVLRANAAARDLIPGLATDAVRCCHELFA